VDSESVRRLLEEVKTGGLTVDGAVARLVGMPYEDLGFARVDHHRALRGVAPEAVYCPGKTVEQIVAIVGRLAAHHANVLATRAEQSVADGVAAAGLACSKA
jgi:NCAIR mutase (PurE)-related protein